MKLTYLMATAVIAAAALTGCGASKVATTKEGIVKTETAVQTENAIHKVMFGHWTITSVNGKLIQSATDRPYVEFAEDTANPFLVKCYAFNGCNFLNGEYAAGQGGTLRPTSDFASTMRMCEGNDYEMGVSLALHNVASYSIQQTAEGGGYTMDFINAAGQSIMTLSKVETDFVNGAWDVTSINGASVDQDLGIQLVIDLDQKSIHGNAGCNTLNGKIVTNPNEANSIFFTQLATTRMTCPNIATEQALVNALSAVTSVVPGEESNTALLRNAAGNAVVTLSRANL